MANKPRHSNRGSMWFSDRLFDCFGVKSCVGKNCRKKIPRVYCHLAKVQSPTPHTYAPADPFYPQTQVEVQSRHAPVDPLWAQKYLQREEAARHAPVDPLWAQKYLQREEAAARALSKKKPPRRRKPRAETIQERAAAMELVARRPSLLGTYYRRR